MSMKYYDEEAYVKAYPLMEEIIPLYRGTDKSEILNYRYAYANFYLKDYVIAGYHFKKFTQIFQSSPRAEEALFMSAYCNYMNSPVYSLDQTNTYVAIDEFKRFRSMYPQSSLNDSAQGYIDELQAKLERKAYENAKLFYTTENYKAAVVALENLVKDYPSSSNEMEVYFLILESSYLLAINSVESKKEERIYNTIEAYYNFVDNFDDKRYVKEAEQMYQSILRHQEGLKK